MSNGIRMEAGKFAWPCAQRRIHLGKPCTRVDPAIKFGPGIRCVARPACSTGQQ
jgi:hypothetical protein